MKSINFLCIIILYLFIVKMVLNAFFTIYRYVDFNVFVCVLCMCFRICKWFARSITNSGHKQLTSRKDKKTINLLLFPTIGNCSLYIRCNKKARKICIYAFQLRFILNFIIHIFNSTKLLLFFSIDFDFDTIELNIYSYI